MRSGIPNIEGLTNLSIQWHTQTKQKTDGDHTSAHANNIEKHDASLMDTWVAKRAVRGGDDDGYEGWS